MKNKIIIMVVLALLMLGLAACNSASDEPLPRSMKGYELYSWREDGGWHFTLITGTNRNKNLEEIISGEDGVTEDGWVNLHASGLAEVKDILSRVPEGGFVFWSDGHFVIVPEGSESPLEMPPAEIVGEVREHAEKCGLDFNVH